MEKRRIATLLVILLALGALVYFQFEHWKKFDWHTFLGQTENLNWWAVLGAVALIYLTYVLRALRWKIFLRPVRHSSCAKLIPPTLIGFTGLALLGRPGEFIRPYLIARKENLTLTSQVGVWAVERIFDIAAFAVLLTADIFLARRELRELTGIHYRTLLYGDLTLLAVVVLAAATAVALQRRGPWVANWLERRLAALSPKLAHHAAHKARAFGEGLNTIHDLKSFSHLILVSLAIWLTIALSYRTVTHAYPGPEVVVYGSAASPQTRHIREHLSSVQVRHRFTDEQLPEGQSPTAAPTTVVMSIPGEDEDSLANPDDRQLDHELARFGLLPDRYARSRGLAPVQRAAARPLNKLDLPEVLLLMAFSMVGSVFQLPAVGGGSQLAVISGLQAVFNVKPELAVSCGVMLWLVTFMTCIPAGLVLAHREHLSLRELSAESHQEEALEEEQEPSAFPGPD